MSYILDALRKADADRERDPARGIHAHPLPALEPARRGVQWPLVAGTLGGLAAVAAAVWLWPAERAPEPAPVAAPAPRPVAVPAAMPVTPPAPAPAPVLAPPLALPAPAPAPAVLPPAPPPVVVAQLAPHTVAASSMASGPQPGPMPPVATKPAPAPVPAAVPAAPPMAAGSTDRILAVGDLPPDIQRDLPKLPISGGVFSENASQRMLIVNGQVANEGAELAPGLVLEQIRPKSAVLKFRGWRYSVAY